MKNIKQNNLTKAIKLAVLTSSVGLVSLASAISFGSGDFSASWDTTISYGISLRAEERDESLIGFSNLVGATPGGDRGRWSINSDNGNLNYDQWDKISNALKITSEFGFSY
ncbi:hypothetical protein MNBD_GAMMA01-306, partial [hydrothermal vent metagenome]